MTDRLSAFTVILEKDMREDDAESLISAICQLRGVLRVSSNLGGYEQQVADERARAELGRKLLEVIYGKK